MPGPELSDPEDPDSDPMPYTTANLSGTHPMEMVYNTGLATADGELYDPTTTLSKVGDGGGTIVTDMLEKNTQKMKCVSCHDIHASGLGSITFSGTDYDIPYLQDVAGIKYALSYSGDPVLEYASLCTTCHEK